MNNLELQSLRRLLFFSVPEAALLVAASPDRPTGVQERTWRRWEDGTLLVPENIAESMVNLAAWRDHALEALRAIITDRERELGFRAETVLVWYDSLDDWATLEGREPILWRPQCAVVAEAVAMGASLIKFDPVSYAQWLGKRKDSEPLRGQWAAETAGA